MIIVFGAVSADLRFDVDIFPGNNEAVEALSYIVTPGGRGANQAVAAIRSGAKVTLIGTAGKDCFGDKILTRLQAEGVIISGVSRESGTTSTITTITNKHGHHIAVTSPGTNALLAAKHLNDELLNDKALVLLQTDTASEENESVLTKAKKARARTMMNLAPSIDMTQKALDNLDYLIVNQGQARQLAKKLNLDVDSSALKMAQGLARQGKLNCIVTLGERGCVAVTLEGIGWTVEALRLEKVVDTSGAEDSYCGTLAACVQAGMPLPRAMKRASIAASLTCTKKGAQNAFPTLDEIDKKINDIPDPKQQEL